MSHIIIFDRLHFSLNSSKVNEWLFLSCTLKEYFFEQLSYSFMNMIYLEMAFLLWDIYVNGQYPNFNCTNNFKKLFYR